MRVIKDRESHVAIELNSEDRLLLRQSEGNILILQHHPAVWFETIDGLGRLEYKYENYWRQLTLASGEPYPFTEALRKMVRGCISEPSGFGEGVLDAIMDALPIGDHHLFIGAEFKGRYCCAEDCAMLAKIIGEKHPIIFSTLQEFRVLPVDQQRMVAQAVGAKLNKEFNLKHTKELFDMSTSAKKKKTPAAAASVKSNTTKMKPGPARADGPVAQARAIFEKMRNADSKAIKEACLKAGINPGTTSVQLGRWRKENGITAPARGPAPSKQKPAKAAPKAKTPAKVKEAAKPAKKEPKAKAKTTAPAANKIGPGNGDEADMRAKRAAMKKEQEAATKKQQSGSAVPQGVSAASAAGQVLSSATTGDQSAPSQTQA